MNISRRIFRMAGACLMCAVLCHVLPACAQGGRATSAATTPAAATSAAVMPAASAPTAPAPAANATPATLEEALAALQPLREGPIDTSPYALEVFYRNTFDAPQVFDREADFTGTDASGREIRTRQPLDEAEWIVEGDGGATIRDGRLRVTSGRYLADGTIDFSQRSHMVVWNKHVFPADYMLDFVVNHGGSDNGLTLLFMSATGLDGESVFDAAQPLRKAMYPRYHSGRLKNYTVSYWSRNVQPLFEAVSNRVRRNPGMNILCSGHSRTDASSDKDYHIRILKVGSTITVEVDGIVVCEGTDPQTPLQEGRVGLRTMEGVKEVSYDDFTVWKVTRKNP